MSGGTARVTLDEAELLLLIECMKAYTKSPGFDPVQWAILRSKLDLAYVRTAL